MNEGTTHIRRAIAAAIAASAFALLVLVSPEYVAYIAVGLTVGFLFRLWFRKWSVLYRPWPGMKAVAGEILLAFALAWVLSTLAGIAFSLLFALSRILGLVGLASTICLVVWALRRRRLSATQQRILWLSTIPIALLAMSFIFLGHIGAPRPLPVVYQGDVTVDHGLLTAKHEITLSEQGKSLDGNDKASDVRGIETELDKCGWRENIEGTFLIVSNQTIRARWIPFTTVNEVRFPPMSCSGLIFASEEHSNITLHAPQHYVVKTDPDATSRHEALSGNIETIVVPVEFRWDKPPSLTFQVASPLLRSSVGGLLLSGTAWKPLKWILLAACGIFAEQIKKGLITPAVRWLFAFLHLPFKETHSDEENTPEESAFDSEEGLGQETRGQTGRSPT